MDGYESARARLVIAQFSQETEQLVTNTIRGHDSTTMCLERKPWEYGCDNDACVPCYFSSLNLTGVVKAYGAGCLAERCLVESPFVDQETRRDRLTACGGVIEPAAMDLGALSREDQGKKILFFKKFELFQKNSDTLNSFVFDLI